MPLRTTNEPTSILAPKDRTATHYSDVIDCGLDSDGYWRGFKEVAITVQMDAFSGSGATMTPTLTYAAALTDISEYDYHTTGDTWVTLRYDTNDQVNLATKFTTAASGASSTPTIHTVTYYMKQVGTIAASKYVWLTLEGDSSGPDGSAVQTSYKIAANGISTTGEYVKFTFREPIALTAGTVYYTVLNGDWTVSTSNHMAIYVDTVVSGGTLFEKDSTWGTVVTTQRANTYCEAIGTWTSVTPTTKNGTSSAFTARTATIEDVFATSSETRYLDANAYGRYVRLTNTASGTVSTCLCSAHCTKLRPQYAE